MTRMRTRSAKCTKFFYGRVWLDPSDADGRRRLQQAYSDLCVTFPAFARSVSSEAFISHPSPAPETAGAAAAAGSDSGGAEESREVCPCPAHPPETPIGRVSMPASAT